MKNFKKVRLAIVVIIILLLSGLAFYFRDKNNPQPQKTNEQAGLKSYLSYTVKEGDTLVTIAEKFYGDGNLWVELAKENNLKEPNLLEVGMILKIPTLKRISASTPLVLTPTVTTARLTYPSQILNLANWKLTLPTGSSEDPTVIKQPELATFQIDPWFIIAPQGSGVRFRAAVNGATTKNSDFPRSELREMTNSGTVEASWNSTSGTHSMFIDQAITAVPFKKKHIVAGQIHDDEDDIIVIRLEDRNLYIRVDGKNVHTFDSDYSLGKRFTIKFVVNGGDTEVYYNGSDTPSYTLDKDYSNAYFKVGAYTQSNCSKEEAAHCNDGNYGEVFVYQATVTHE